MNNNPVVENLNTFELALLILLALVALYFIYQAVREYRNAKTVRAISQR